jgi:hypothetical protein
VWCVSVCDREAWIISGPLGESARIILYVCLYREVQSRHSWLTPCKSAEGQVNADFELKMLSSFAARRVCII